jgi:hypothetical protein
MDTSGRVSFEAKNGEDSGPFEPSCFAAAFARKITILKKAENNVPDGLPQIRINL